jgi:MFS transporter, SET family, sugar efflux transporter
MPFSAASQKQQLSEPLSHKVFRFFTQSFRIHMGGELLCFGGVVMPGAVGFAFADSGSMRGAWGVAGLCAVANLFCAAFLLRKERDQRASGRLGGAFLAALKEIAAPLMLARMISMASLTGTIRLASTLWPLILTIKLGGKSADVGMVAGLIAFLEIPFMLIWAALLKRLSLLTILATAGLVYGGYMAALSFATAPWQIYLLALPGAAGAAALLSMPLTYFRSSFQSDRGWARP